MNRSSNPAQDLLAQRAYERWAHLSTADDVASALGAFTPYDDLPEFHREIWRAVVDEVCRGAWCVDCLDLLYDMRQGLRLIWRDENGQTWNRWVGRTAEVTALANQYTIEAFETAPGDRVGMYAVTVAGSAPVCTYHFAIRSQANQSLPPQRRPW